MFTTTTTTTTISLVLQSNMDLGLLHNPPPIMLILSLHSQNLDAHPPEVLLHDCYPAFSWSSLFLPAIDFFIQELSRHTMIIHVLHMTQAADPP
jgi:hypothetical protein